VAEPAADLLGEHARELAEVENESGLARGFDQARRVRIEPRAVDEQHELDHPNSVLRTN